MEVHFVNQGEEISQSLIDHAIKMFKPLEKRYPQITNANIFFESTAVAATLLVNETEIHAIVKNVDKYNAINDLAEKLLGLVKNKEKTK